MNTEDYISSGILQDYCLGLLTNIEEGKVEKICNEFPELGKELQLLRLALENYAGAMTEERKAVLYQDIWKIIKTIKKNNI